MASRVDEQTQRIHNAPRSVGEYPYVADNCRYLILGAISIWQKRIMSRNTNTISGVSVFMYLRFLEHINIKPENDHNGRCKCIWNLYKFGLIARDGTARSSTAVQTIVDKTFPNALCGTDGGL